MARRQQEKSKLTRNELLEAAMRLFNAKGFAATTIAEITADAGYAKGSFYRHWKGKDDLFFEILEHKLKTYREARADKVRTAQTLEEVFTVIWDFLESIIDDRNWAKVFLEFTIHAARDEELRAKLNGSKYRLSNELFADLVRPHMTTDFSPEVMGSLNTAIFEGFLLQSVLETNVLPRQRIREAALLLAKTYCLGQKPPAIEDGPEVCTSKHPKE